MNQLIKPLMGDWAVLTGQSAESRRAQRPAPLPQHNLGQQIRDTRIARPFLWGTSLMAALGLVLAAPSPSRADSLTESSSTEAYELCGTHLQALGLTALETAQVCAQSLRPAELATCATTIAGSIAMATGKEGFDLSATGLMPLTIVESCDRVRRPLALGICVEEIQLSETFSMTPALVSPVLETCRRSRLPDVLANCTVGLATTTDLEEGTILTTCLEGEAGHFEFSGMR